jgi:hypothetical protein
VPACVNEQIASLIGGGERRERLGIAGDDSAPVGDERRDARRSIAGPTTDAGFVSRGGDHDPEYVRRLRRERACNVTQLRAEARCRRRDDEQRAQGAGTANDANILERIGEPEPGAGVRIEGVGTIGEAEEGGHRDESVWCMGGREELGGLTECEHERMLRTTAERYVIARLRRVSIRRGSRVRCTRSRADRGTAAR